MFTNWPNMGLLLWAWVAETVLMNKQTDRKKRCLSNVKIICKKKKMSKLKNEIKRWLKENIIEENS